MSVSCTMIFFLQRGDTCLHFLETLRNQTILQCILNEYQALGVSVDVESLVNTLHTNDIIVIFTTTTPYLLQHSECSPLSISCIHGAVNSAELLLKYGANPNGCENVSEIKVIKLYVCKPTYVPCCV